MREGSAKSAVQREVRIDDLRCLIEMPDAPDEVVRAEERRGCAEAGYWAHLWPSALELARYLARSGLVGPGQRVVEIGCGLALPGIVAAMRSAEVTLTDASEHALAFAARNAAANGVRARCTLFDWTSTPPEGWAFDLLLGADVLYHPGSPGPVARLIARLGCPALLAVPDRPGAGEARQALRTHGLAVWDAPAEGCRIILAQAQ